MHESQLVSVIAGDGVGAEVPEEGDPAGRARRVSDPDQLDGLGQTGIPDSERVARRRHQKVVGQHGDVAAR